jgi:hypothetical protein
MAKSHGTIYFVGFWGIHPVGADPAISPTTANGGMAMSKVPSTVTFILVLVALTAASAVLAQNAVPDLRGTWKGESESIVLGGGNAHHTGGSASEPELRSVTFTLTIDKQDGRRFSGTFSSARGGSKVIAVISRNGTIFLADTEGVANGTMLASDRMELCYLKDAPEARVASCVELTKQP